MGEPCGQEECTADVSELPPSAKQVFKSLQYTGELTQQGLVEETRLSQRTVRNAIRSLEENDMVTSQINFQDARQRIYTLAAPYQSSDTDHE